MARTLIYRRCPANANEQGQAVYWDDQIKNQVSQPVYFGGTCTLFTLPQNTLLEAWCEGTTRKEAYTVWDGTGRPPRIAYAITETPNSEHCSANPCGLRVLDVQLVATGDTFRATVISSLTSNVEYSLNNFADVQDSPVFENLTPGTYNVKVRTKA